MYKKVVKSIRKDFRAKNVVYIHGKWLGPTNLDNSLI